MSSFCHEQSYAGGTDNHHLESSDTQAFEKSSLLDELLPLPTTTSSDTRLGRGLLGPLKRIGSITVILTFLFAISYTACIVEISGRSTRKNSVTWTQSINGYISDSMSFTAPLLNPAVPDSADQVSDEDKEGDIWEEGEEALGLQLADTTSSPDWAKYTFIRTLPPSHVDTNIPGKRVIFVGDVHGSYDSLRRLLKKIAYDSTKDLLIHVGDLIAKGPEPQKVLTFMRKNRARGVRGNHDEKVIEWRNWMIWAGTKGSDSIAAEQEDDSAANKAGGWRAMLSKLDWEYGADKGRLLTQLQSLGRPFPDDWEWRSEHWKIARDMSKKDYEYLVSLPLALHIPSIHSLVVHAGLLARDTTKDALDVTQPYDSLYTSDLSQPPALSRADGELAVLRLIKQNRQPYTLLNIRSVLKNGDVTKSSNKGTPWSEIWQQEQSRCQGKGFTPEDKNDLEDDREGEPDLKIEEVEDLEKRKKHKGMEKLPPLNCSPLTVIYGHAAARGLDIKPYSKGLDSGCVYGKELTAMILGDVDSLEGIHSKRHVRVGAERGVLIQVDCPALTKDSPSN